MPSQFDEFMTAGLGEVAQIVGLEQFTIAGAPFVSPLAVTGSWNILANEETLTLRGREVSFRINLVVSTAQFTVAPRQGQLVTRVATALQYRVMGRITELDEVGFYTLVLDDVNK